MGIRLLRLTWGLAIFLSVFGVSDGWGAVLGQTKPKIVRQPVKQTVVLGGHVSFEVAVQSTTPVSYQWRLNKVAITGATTASYTIDPVAFESGGKYDVVARNEAGAVTSRAVVLVVDLVPPRLPVGTAIFDELTVHGINGTATRNRSWMVSDKITVIDPEDPTYSPYSHFVYQPAGVNRAILIIYGRVFDSRASVYLSMKATCTLDFTGVSSGGDLECSSHGKIVYVPPDGYRPSKLNYAFSGTTSIDLP